MNDRFRFRVWNKKNKKMIYNAEIAYDGMNYNTSWQLGKNTNDGWVDCFGYYLDYPEDYEVMQCTGHKDKNEKLIYEADILKIDEISRLVIVRFKGISFELYAEPTNIPGYHNDKYIPEDCEIVGNIYENKELLNENS